MRRYLQPIPVPISRRARESEALEPIFQLKSVLSNRWLIVSVGSVITLLAIVFALSVKPVYESNILIQITRHASPSAEVQAETPAATEIEILRSRAILARVVNALRLDIAVAPTYFPVVGAWIARNNPGISAPGLFGVGGYVWGSDQVRVTALTVPDALLGRPFDLFVMRGNTYMLSQEELGIRLRGMVGQRARVLTRYGPVEVLVAGIDARPGAHFTLHRSRPFQAVDGLQRSLAIAEKGRQSNVIGVALRGADPVLISQILNELGDQYLQQQTTRNADEVKSQLAFYDQQVTQSRRRIEALDARLDALMHVHGAADLSEDARMLAQQSVALHAELSTREQRNIELSGRFGERHPDVIAVSRHIAAIRRDLADIETRRKAFAAAQQELLTLNRDKQVYSEAHFALLNARQKLDALMLSNHANVRVVDRAQIPLQPVTLGLPVMVMLSCLLGLVGGMGASVLKNALVRRNVRLRETWGVRRLAIADQTPLNAGDDGDASAQGSAAQR